MKPIIGAIKHLDERTREVSVKVPPATGNKLRDMKVLVSVPDPPPVMNEAGWRKTADGRWVPAFKEVDGKVVPTEEVWDVPAGVTEETLIAPIVEMEVNRVLNTEAAVAKTSKLPPNHKFTRDGITVSFTKKPQYPEGWVEVYILAVDAAGKLLNVHDGAFRYYNPPEGWDVESAILTTIADLNGGP